MDDNKVKEIKIVYEDGTEITVDRGMCFRLYNDGDYVFAHVESVGSEVDEITVLTIASKIAREIGITEELISKAEEVRQDG